MDCHRTGHRRAPAGGGWWRGPVRHQGRLHQLQRHRADRRLLRRPDPPPPAPGTGGSTTPSTWWRSPRSATPAASW